MHPEGGAGDSKTRPQSSGRLTRSTRWAIIVLVMFEQLSLFSPSPLGGPTISEPYTVSQLTGHIKRIVDDDPVLSDIWIEGEVSNFKQAASRHCYLTLKDAGSQIPCVIWRNVLLLTQL